MSTEDGITRYIKKRTRELALIEAMWRDPRVQCYNDAARPPPEEESEYGSIFLAGPTSRNQILEYNWRSQAVAYLREAGFLGFIYVPEPRGEELVNDFTERDYIYTWESSRLLGAKRVVFWIPRNLSELLGLNTNFEFGIFVGKLLFVGLTTPLFIGWPLDAIRMGLPSHYLSQLAKFPRFITLKRLCEVAAGKSEH